MVCSEQNITLRKECPSLLDPLDEECEEMVLKYIEDGDLRHWTLPDIKAFNIGWDERCSKLNCITEPFMYKQLDKLKMSLRSTDEAIDTSEVAEFHFSCKAYGGGGPASGSSIIRMD